MKRSSDKFALEDFILVYFGAESSVEYRVSEVFEGFTPGI